jgi:hypothetical protein
LADLTSSSTSTLHAQLNSRRSLTQTGTNGTNRASSRNKRRQLLQTLRCRLRHLTTCLRARLKRQCPSTFTSRSPDQLIGLLVSKLTRQDLASDLSTSAKQRADQTASRACGNCNARLANASSLLK